MYCTVRTLTDDLVGGGARQSEACGFRVDLHGPPQGLLGSVCHAGDTRTAFTDTGIIGTLDQLSCRDPQGVLPVSLIQDDDLVSPFREGDFLLGKHLDLVSNYIEASEEDA